MNDIEKRDAIAQRYYQILAEWQEFARLAALAEKHRIEQVNQERDSQ